MNPEARDLNDERSLRLGLEERLADEVDRTALWRRRAEARMERIQELEQRLEQPSAPVWLRRLRSLIRPPRPAAPPVPLTGSRRPRPALPTVSVAALVAHPSVVPVAEEASVLDSRPGAVSKADLVLVDGTGWERAEPDHRHRLREALAQPDRPPLVVWSETSCPPDLADQAQVRLSLHPGSPTGEFLAGSYPRVPPSFPGGARPTTATELASPNPGLVTDAAAGRPLSIDGLPDDPAVGAHRSVRWAFRHHRPARKLAQILDMAGVPHPDPTPRVAAVLVSNRADLVEAALARLGAQTWRPLEVVVGLHGFQDPGLKTPAEDIEVAVHSFPQHLTLGECLNRAVETSTADVIAKVDDDDHYGPAYLEDAVRDLSVTDAPVVGKATVYAYLAGQDRTVLRRPGTEHRHIDGILGGNTMVFERGLWEAVPFPHRPRFVDRIFLEAALALGHGLYSGGRFEFCAVRHGSGHTFSASDTLFAAGAEEAWPGLHPERCFVADLETVGTS